VKNRGKNAIFTTTALNGLEKRTAEKQGTAGGKKAVESRK